MFTTPLAQFNLALMLAVTAFALIVGDRTARVIAGAGAVGWIASAALQDRSSVVDPEWGILAVDLVLLGVYAVVIARSPRAWPLFTTAFHLLILASHLSFMIDARVKGWAFYTAYFAWSYAVLATVAFGAVVAWRDRRRSARARRGV